MNKKEQIKFISPTITTGTKCISRYSYADLSYAKIRVAAGGITWTDYVLTFAARDIRKVKQIFKTVPPGGQLHKK